MSGSTVVRRFAIRPIRPITIRNALVGGALPALAGALVLAGCSSGGAAGTSAASVSASPTASLSAFESCLKQHGVNVSAGQFGARPSGTAFPSGVRPTGSFTPRAFPSGVRPSGVRPSGSFGGANSAAFQACSKYAPAGFAGGGGAAISSSALAAFKSCLSSNGVKVTGTTAPQILAELRNATGKTATALKTCEVLIRPSTPTPTASA